MKRDFAGASAEAQVKYLQQCLRIQMDKKATLAMELETQKMAHHLATKEMGARLNDLQDICNRQRNQLLELRRQPAPWGWVWMSLLVLVAMSMAVWVFWRTHG